MVLHHQDQRRHLFDQRCTTKWTRNQQEFQFVDFWFHVLVSLITFFYYGPVKPTYWPPHDSNQAYLCVKGYDPELPVLQCLCLDVLSEPLPHVVEALPGDRCSGGGQLLLTHAAEEEVLHWTNRRSVLPVRTLVLNEQGVGYLAQWWLQTLGFKPRTFLMGVNTPLPQDTATRIPSFCYIYFYIYHLKIQLDEHLFTVF